MTNTLKNERAVVILLAATQFTHILDFVLMMPLGPILMREFAISVSSFGLMVSSYTFSSAIVGLIGALWIDRFDRRGALLFSYAGFTMGTLACYFAWNFESLTAARIFAGAFGGLITTLTFTIIGDTVPEVRRGWATGVVMAAFSVASVIGVPIGIALAESSTWNLPFLALAVVSSVVFYLLKTIIPPLKSHIKVETQKVPIRSRVLALWKVAQDRIHLTAFALTTLLMFAAWTLIPFISPFLVFNLGVKESELPLTYFCGGLLTFFTSRWIGRLADKHGKYRVFWIMAILSFAPILTLTNLTAAPLWAVLIVTTLFMSLVSGRFVPAMSLITSAADPKQRGSFMSLNNSLRHLASGSASLVGGYIIAKNPATGALDGYHISGFIAVAATVVCIFLAKKIRIRA